jgi:hypothetical protein
MGKVWNYQGHVVEIDGAGYLEFYLRGKEKGIKVPKVGDRDEAVALLEAAGEIWEQ